MKLESCSTTSTRRKEEQVAKMMSRASLSTVRSRSRRKRRKEVVGHTKAKLSTSKLVAGEKSQSKSSQSDQ